MSFYRKKLLFPDLNLFVPRYSWLHASRLAEDPPDADLGEVGEPQVSCGKVGEVRLLISHLASYFWRL